MNKGLTFIVNLVILIVGVLLIALSRRPDGVRTIIFVTGVAFIIPAVVNVFMISREGVKSEQNPEGRSSAARIMGWLTCGGAIILGVVMCFSPETFHSLFVYILALALLFGGLFHLYMLSRGLRPVIYPTWMFAMPALLIVGALCLAFISSMHEAYGQPTAILISGLGCVIFALTTLMEYIGWRSHRRHQAHLAKQQAADETKSADANHQIEG